MDLKKKSVRRLIDSIQADAVIVHLNPLQELMQPEGDHTFSGIGEGIHDLIGKVDCPVIVKETGAGISAGVAKRLLNMGVSVIDVSGAGGTSWARVENLRENQKFPLHEFDDWGLPTVECIQQVRPLKEQYSFEMIASGGIRSSFDVIKALALGADFTAAAQPIIQAIVDGGYELLQSEFEKWKKQATTILTLLGCNSFAEVGSNHIIKKR